MVKQMKIKKIKRNIKYWFQRRIRGWSDDECWNIDWEFIKWINSRFKQYIKDAEKSIDLEYYKFNYKNQEYTQKQIINRIIKLSDEVLKIYFDYDRNLNDIILNNVNEIFDLFKMIFWYMWW